MASLQIVTPPSAEPVTLAAMKLYLRVETPNEDDLISGLIAAAREKVEGFTGRSLINKAYRQTLDSFPYYVDSVMSQMAYPPAYYSLPRYSTTLWNYSQMIKLLVAPLVSVERIDYRASSDGQWRALVNGIQLWFPMRSYALGAKVRDVNDNIQRATNAGVSAGDPPTWNTVVTGTTVDAGTTPITWVNDGATKKDSFYIDVDSCPGRIFPGPAATGASLAFWPAVLYVPNAVQIYFTAGHGTTPAELLTSGRQGMITAIMQLVAAWHEHREAVSPLGLQEIPTHVQNLLWNHKVYDLQPTRG